MESVLPHKVLVISNKPPYPAIDGGCYAMGKFEQLLRMSFESVYYFALSTPKHPFIEDANPEYWKRDINFFTEFIDTKIQNKHVLKYFAGSSIRAARFYCTDIEKKILSIIKEHKIEIVFFESIYSAVYLKPVKQIPSIKTFIRSHNIEHQIWEKYFETMPRGLKRLAFRSETSRLESYEEKCYETVEGNIFISENDLKFYKESSRKENGTYIPVQMEVKASIQNLQQDGLKLFHIGAMDWLPNVEGIEHFIIHTFPSILSKYPKTELHLAGKAMPKDFYKYQSDHIFIHGEVENAQTFIDKFDVLIVPIESGSGIRIKVLEAMASGKPVISTQQGINGIMAQNKKEYLLVHDTNSWLNAVEYLNDNRNYTHIASEAIKLIENNYSENALLKKLVPFIQKQISHGH